MKLFLLDTPLIFREVALQLEYMSLEAYDHEDTAFCFL